MTFIPPGETVIETRKCPISGKEFFLTEQDRAMYEMLSPIIGGHRLNLSLPTLYPEERQIRRMMWRNYDQFYKNTCAITGKDVIATYRPGTPYKVTTAEVWWSDDWQPESFGKVIDFSRPFFDQFRDLDQAVYHMPLSVSKSENSAFTNFSVNNRNCYLCSRIADCEYCYYSLLPIGCKYCVDCYNVTHSEYLYECIRTSKSYHCFYCTDCENCRNAYFLKDCTDCEQCFGSCNLRNARYVFNNSQLTESEYKTCLSQALKTTQDASILRENFLHFCEQFPKKYIIGNNNENTLGNYNYFNKDNMWCFDGKENNNIRYCFGSVHVEDSADMSFGYFQKHSLEISGGTEAYNILFGMNCLTGCHDLLYCKDCVNSTTDSFGCVSLKKGHHCLLNTPYSQHEYETLIPRLVDHMRSTGEWGEFFPSEYSPYLYNESAAYAHFPHEKAWALERGLGWYDAQIELGAAYYTPLTITEYDEKHVGYEQAKQNIDTLLAETLYCIETGKPYRIIGQELAFYIENSLPIPRKHPTVRANARMKQTLPAELYERTCSDCQTPLFTPYASERPEKILCEECYRKLVY